MKYGEVNIYTDGSCRGKTKTGGYGYIVVKDGEIIERFVKKELNTTNQRMELKALLSAYKYYEENNINQGTILSDSSYCLNCNFEKWYVKWEKNGFISSKGAKVLNKDLWEQIIPYFKNSSIQLKKVPGHKDCYYNNFIDSLVTTISSSRTDDLTNKKFNKLQVISLWGNKFTENTNTTYWKCKCDCGNETIVSHTNLCNNLTKSCGCIKSKGEEKIAKILTENSINFIREYKIKKLKDKDYLKFDFAIFKENKLHCLIEYQGKQHYTCEQNGWNNKEHLLLTQKHDEMKKKYCRENNIKLVEIPYYDYDKIDWEYLKEVVFK